MENWELAHLYANLDELPSDERFKKMKPVERWHLASMNAYPIRIGDDRLDSWVESSKQEDVHGKLDCTCGEYRAQLKTRTKGSGNDVLFAVIQPEKTYLEKKYGLNIWNGADLPKANDMILKGVFSADDYYGRDWKFDGNVYNCLSKDFCEQRIMPAGVVKELIRKSLIEWAISKTRLIPGAGGIAFNTSKGVQLRAKYDSHSHKRKVLAFIPSRNESIVRRKMLPVTDELKKLAFEMKNESTFMRNYLTSNGD